MAELQLHDVRKSYGAVNVIKGVGNYGEIFERNIGVDTPLKIQRGQNALWTKGGLQYGMPIR